MIGSDAQRGEPGLRCKIRKAHAQRWPDLARPRILSPAETGFVVVSLIKNHFEGGTDGFETN
jgi:hypothetical protein